MSFTPRFPSNARALYGNVSGCQNDFRTIFHVFARVPETWYDTDVSVIFKTMAGMESAPSDSPTINAQEHRAAIGALEGVPTLTLPAVPPKFDKSLEKPPVMPAADLDASEEAKAYEKFDRAVLVLQQIKNFRRDTKFLYRELNDIGERFSYKDDRTDLETAYLSSVLEGKVKIAGDNTRENSTKDPAKMTIVERTEKAEWLAEGGNVLDAEREFEIAKTQIALIKENIRIAYSNMHPELK